MHGTLVLDADAARAVEQRGESILTAGVLHVRGDFDSNEMIQIADPEGRPIAKGLSNYSAREMTRMVCQTLSAAHFGLPYGGIKELVHHRNIVLEIDNRRI
jgi:glutamate 5-kinase